MLRFADVHLRTQEVLSRIRCIQGYLEEMMTRVEDKVSMTLSELRNLSLKMSSILFQSAAEAANLAEISVLPPSITVRSRAITNSMPRVSFGGIELAAAREEDEVGVQDEGKLGAELALTVTAAKSIEKYEGRLFNAANVLDREIASEMISAVHCLEECLVEVYLRTEKVKVMKKRQPEGKDEVSISVSVVQGRSFFSALTIQGRGGGDELRCSRNILARLRKSDDSLTSKPLLRFAKEQGLQIIVSGVETGVNRSASRMRSLLHVRTFEGEDSESDEQSN